MEDKDFKTYTAQGTLTKEGITERLSLGRLIFLAIVSMLLCTVGPLSLFAPVPLAISFLLYSRGKSLAVAIGVFVVTLALAAQFSMVQEIIAAPIIFVFATVYAFLSAKVILDGEHPVRGLIKNGSIVVGILLALVGILALSSELSLQDLVINQVTTTFKSIQSHPDYNTIMDAGGPQARVLSDFLGKPNEIAQLILNWAFAASFVTVFFGLWLTQFMLLRNSVLWKLLHNYSYGVKELVKFRVPEAFIYLLITGMVFTLGGDYVLGKTGEVIGINILYCMSVFYFFQGFGVYLDFLTHLKVRGLFRSFFIIMAIMMAWKVIVFVGVFDLWVNFRKFFKKKRMNKEI